MRFPKKLQLARLPSPIVKLERLSKRLGKTIWLWRDDLTGFIESGNKIRKLEYLLADAMKQRASYIVSCGGPQSNHARATVCLARRLGLPVRILIREPKESFCSSSPANGNLLIDQIFGAEIKTIPFAEYQAQGSSYTPFLERELASLKDQGENPYVIPEGGSCALGSFGYLTAVEEMLTVWQNLGTGKKAPDSLFCALGSGGTLAGLVLGYCENGLPYQTIHAINVCDSAAYFQERVGRLLQETIDQFGFSHQPAELSIHDGYFGRAYAFAEDAELRFYAEIARTEGILLDPVYTGKAFQGMIKELEQRPQDYGCDILFLHSGGIFANFAFAEQYQRALANF